MFRKNLKRELMQYIRCLWPFTIAVVVCSILSYILIVNDHNPYEAWGVVMGGFLFGSAALTFLVRGIFHAFIAFSNHLSALKTENELSLTQLLCVQILAFAIFILFTTLLVIGGVSVFAWNSMVQMFYSFATDWPYFLEFLLYLIIAAITLFIIPAAMTTVFRQSKQKKWPRVLTLIICIVFSLIHFALLVFEIQLMIHSPSTNMLGLWISILTMLLVTIIVDICMYLLMYRTLQNTLQDTN